MRKSKRFSVLEVVLHFFYFYFFKKKMKAKVLLLLQSDWLQELTYELYCRMGWTLNIDSWQLLLRHALKLHVGPFAVGRVKRRLNMQPFRSDSYSVLGIAGYIVSFLPTIPLMRICNRSSSILFDQKWTGWVLVPIYTTCTYTKLR